MYEYVDINITLYKSWGMRRKMEDNIWVVGEVRVGVELGNKRVHGNRENSNARNKEVIIQLILRVRRTEKPDEKLLQNCTWGLTDILYSQHFLMVGYFLLYIWNTLWYKNVKAEYF